jgi:hypothetical protein
MATSEIIINGGGSEDALHILAVLEALKESIETGNRVRVKSYG